MPVRSAALYVAGKQVLGHRLEHGGRNLCAGGVVEEHETSRPLESRKPPAHIVDRKRAGDGLIRHGRGGACARTQWISSPETEERTRRCIAGRPRKRSWPKSPPARRCR